MWVTCQSQFPQNCSVGVVSTPENRLSMYRPQAVY
jgi:hypothetical protein